MRFDGILTADRQPLDVWGPFPNKLSTGSFMGTFLEARYGLPDGCSAAIRHQRAERARLDRAVDLVRG
jgi:hypothetical protein